MTFHQIRAGGDRNFAYLVGDRGEAALFDPPPDPSLYQDLLAKEGLEVIYIVATHGHGDHTWGLEAARKATGGKVVAHSASSLGPDVAVTDGETLPLGGLEMKFIHTPGHTMDSMCILVGGKLITGDTLFVGKVGGTDYGEGARLEYESLHGKLMTLPDEVEVWPGHDYGTAPTSTIGKEKKTNPFLLQPSFEDFLELKKNWLQYKREHGIP